MPKYIVVIILLLCVSFSSCATLSSSASFYQKALYFAKKKDYDMSFMYLKAILNDNPKSFYAPKAAFSVGEYYYENNDYLDAMVAFRKYIQDYPKDDGVIFAELFIYTMATTRQPSKNIPIKERYFLESIRKKMFSKPVFFIFFEDKKTFSYRSMLGNVYQAIDYVDKVRVTRNDKILLDLSP